MGVIDEANQKAKFSEHGYKLATNCTVCSTHFVSNLTNVHSLNNSQ